MRYSVLILTALTQFNVAHATCEKTNPNGLNTSECTTTGLASGAGIYGLGRAAQRAIKASGIESAGEAAAEAFINRNRQVIASHIANPQTHFDPASLSRSLRENDRIDIRYNLSEAANRSYHISELNRTLRESTQAISHASSTISSINLQILALNLSTSSNQKGNESQIQRLQFLQSQLGTAQFQLDQATREFANAQSELARVNAGGSVPVRTFSQVFESGKSSNIQARAFLEDLKAKGSQLRELSALSEAHVAQLEKMNAKVALEAGKIKGKALRNLGAGFVGLAIVVEEATNGAIAHQLDKHIINPEAYTPTFQPSERGWDR